MELERIQSFASWRAVAYSRMGRLLFEPSRAVTDPAERRRARLLAKLQLAHAAQLAFGLMLVVTMVAGPPPPRGMLVILSVALPGIIVAYALSRSRRVRLSIWVYVAFASAITPTTILFCLPGQPQMVPLLGLCYLLPPVLLASAMGSARATLVTSFVQLTTTLVAMKISGAFSFADEGVWQGCLFFFTCVALIVIFSVHRDHIAADGAAELKARNTELELLRQTLEEKVTERTRALSIRTTEMRLVLDHIAQGIFTIDATGKISSEHSAALTSWFGPIVPGESLVRYLGRLSADFAEGTELARLQLVDDVLPLEVSLAQMPATLAIADRRYRFSYDPIDAEQVGRLLVVVSDVTSEIERELAQREKKETFAVFEQVLANRHGLVNFMDEASEIIACLLDPTCDRVEVQRALHTLKGNATLMGIQSVSDLCHLAESRLEEEGRLTTHDLAGLAERWARLTADVDAFLGAGRDVIETSPERHRMLERAVREGAPQETLARIVHELTLEPAQSRLQVFADHVRRLAHRFDKQISVEVQDQGLYLDERPWAKLWASFVHAVRNAVDHGIEGPVERRAAGKSEEGHITLRASHEGLRTILEIEDDGRGIDWEAVRRRCLAKGLPAASHADLFQGLFFDGVSTAETVTDISGRGVGMGALRAAVWALDGELDVRSEWGKGTLVRMEFPPTPGATA